MVRVFLKPLKEMIPWNFCVRVVIAQKMQEAIIYVAVALETEPDRPPIPYGDPACRKALYEVLLMMVTSPSTEWPPPVQCAVAIFRKGCHDANPQVSTRIA